MKTVIMAGGKGTRIASIASDIPKPMIPIGGVPVLEHEIKQLAEQGFDDIIITVSHLGSVIMDYFDDGSRFNVKIEYFFEEVPLGNAGALFQMKEKLTEDFLLLNADAIFDIDFKRFVEFHKSHGKAVTIFTHPNNHPYDSGLIVTNEDGVVEQWLAKEDDRPEFYKNRVNAGLHVLSPEVLDLGIDTPTIDLDRQVLKPMVVKGEVMAYDSPEYVMDMGTPERYHKVEKDYNDGIVEAKNLARKQRAIFIDRDGTINEHIGFVRSADDIKILPGVAEAIKKINESGRLAIVITNQPVIARGEVTEEELWMMHNKIETLLGEEGAYLDGIYYCPHHPDKGFVGEIPELKIECDCRKPKPGLILRAAENFNIDLNNSWMIGDSENDVLAGKNAGCKTGLVALDKSYGEDIKEESLLEIINKILSNKEEV
ncbi:MAG: HAD-IIIA family hydrolase [Candidatus Saccharibacteria bacterium]|nr:HAD-IIIA family hydrolase [Candidatus Saccharibacteria bacterium]